MRKIILFVMVLLIAVCANSCTKKRLSREETIELLYKYPYIDQVVEYISGIDVSDYSNIDDADFVFVTFIKWNRTLWFPEYDFYIYLSEPVPSPDIKINNFYMEYCIKNMLYHNFKSIEKEIFKDDPAEYIIFEVDDVNFESDRPHGLVYCKNYEDAVLLKKYPYHEHIEGNWWYYEESSHEERSVE